MPWDVTSAPDLMRSVTLSPLARMFLIDSPAYPARSRSVWWFGCAIWGVGNGCLLGTMEGVLECKNEDIEQASLVVYCGVLSVLTLLKLYLRK